jgi:sulfatase maturation enzyme AslB (radical SAM superfamily)
LKCRICTPFLSSQWIKEIKDLQVLDMGAVDSFTSNSKEKFSANAENKEILKKWAPTVDFLEFFGGEPLMQQEHDEILQIIYDYGNTANTGLYYNTNSTVLKEKFFELWKLFKKVIINFSVDDCGDRFEYQRKNAKWEESLYNIKMFKEYGKKHGVNLDLRIYVTVGILNIFYLKEFFNEIKNLGIKVTLNMVHYPHHYAITILPDKIKNIIRDKLLTIDTDIVRKDSLQIDNIIKFMYNTDYNPKLLETFWEKTEIHDRYRNESYSNTFPEFYNILKEVK